jgi:hypothetical protein
VSNAIQKRIEYLQGDLGSLHSKTEAGEVSEFIKWALKKRYEFMIETMEGIITRLKIYQEDVENEGFLGILKGWKL